MVEGLEELTKMEYPGRFIIIGQDNRFNNIVVYGITGRRPSSQARRLELDKDGKEVWVNPTDEEVVKKGNVDLLIYPAISMLDFDSKDKMVVVSNGKQTRDIKNFFNIELGPTSMLTTALYNREYEPDEICTPRISGCVIDSLAKTPHAALSIIKRDKDGSTLRNYFEVPINPGRGKLISTYTGVNKDPVPSFEGEPLDILLKGKSADETAKNVYNALAPKDNGKDFRVGVAVVYFDIKKRLENKIEIINRFGLDMGGLKCQKY